VSSFTIEVLDPRLEALIAPDTGLEQVATGFRFTEGPLWDPRDGGLLFSDIPANRIYRWKEGERATVFREPSGKSNGLTWDLDGSLLACEHAGRRVSRELLDGRIEAVVTHYRGRRLNSPNDLVVRSDGTLYFTDPPYGLTAEFGEVADQEQPINALYLLRPEERDPMLLAEDFDRPNGLAFSPDEQRLYVADTSRYQVRVFDVASDGMLTNSRVAAQFREEQGVGRPDGMKVDVEGNLYTTGPGGVWVMAPDFTILGHLSTPEKAANLGWGDADWRSLFITASTSVYRLRTCVSGPRPVRA
jgi:gluconolactonase